MIHEAFIYTDDQEFAEVLAPFLAEAVAANQGAVAITSPARVRALEEALGPDRASVAFFESERWYARPGETLAAWRATLDGFPAAQTVRPALRPSLPVSMPSLPGQSTSSS